MIKYIAAAALLLLPIPALAAEPNVPDPSQPWCEPRPELVKILKRDFNEEPISGGLSTNGLVVEVFASPEGATFTVVITHPVLGQSCVVQAGFGWHGGPVGRET